MIKLGILVGVAYVVGGRVGDALTSGKGEDVRTGARWAGRIATFGVAAYVLR